MEEYTKEVFDHTVHDMMEYMECIKQYDLNHCISRGEDRKYPGLNAAAFRRNAGLNIQKMVGAFEQQIGNTLTEMQRKHILAFSQHHGLPTNLLDFTFSPLISLYFACTGEAEEPGYVYFLKKDRLINISEHLELINSLLFPALLISEERIRDLFSEITNIFIKNEEYVFEFLQYIDESIGIVSGNEAIHKEIIKLLNNRGNYDIERLEKLTGIMKKKLKSIGGIETEVPPENLGLYGCLYVQMLWILLFIVHHQGNFSTPFYFTYEPANITNRISNQSSVFIYQLYGINEVRQEIHPDITLKIKNKTKIMEQLDALGINEQFIFNDYDHIAAYIKKKYLKLSDEREQVILRLNELSSSDPFIELKRI